MPNRYQATFKKLQEQEKIGFIPFWTIGDPNEEESLEIIKKIGKSADILEFGVPFSDPLADGKTIQDSVERALSSGMNPIKALNLVKKIREIFPEKPIGLLVYFNLIIQVGPEKFFRLCEESGVDSILIPELPIEEIESPIDQSQNSIKNLAKKFSIDLIFLVSTNTPANRVEKILETAGGFLYCISTPSITGAKSDISPATIEMIKNLKQKTDLPLAVGFGISSPEHIQILKKSGAHGAIIGSKLFQFRKNIPQLEAFLKSCHQAR